MPDEDCSPNPREGYDLKDGNSGRRVLLASTTHVQHHEDVGAVDLHNLPRQDRAHARRWVVDLGGTLVPNQSTRFTDIGHYELG